MSFEVTFHYYDRKEDGKGYDMDNSATYTRQLGKENEEVSLDKLAVMIMKQLARRDRMVYDVEINEYVKRKISFKETNGGILIKNKKFVLDGNATVQEEEVPEDIIMMPQSDDEPLHQPQPRAAMIQSPQRQPSMVAQPQRHEVFMADASAMHIMTKRGCKLTPQKRYAILKEEVTNSRVNVGGIVQSMPTYEYVIMDDDGNHVKMPSVCFEPERRGLLGQGLINRAEADRNSGPRLLYQGPTDNQMPVLR